MNPYDLELPDWMIEYRNELRSHGFKFRGDVKSHNETPETVKKKLNLTDEQWNALRDAK